MVKSVSPLIMVSILNIKIIINLYYNKTDHTFRYHNKKHIDNSQIPYLYKVYPLCSVAYI